MTLTSTLYRFKIQLSDVDRGVYEPLELRVAMHPSESTPYLLTRVIAYGLNFQEGLEFTQGIAATDEPALQVKDLTGALLVWIEIGNPTARRLHKAAKASRRVRVYTYRDVTILQKEAATAEIHRSDEIEVFSLEPSFLARLGETVSRDNSWQLLHTDGELAITIRNTTIQGEVRSHRLALPR